MVMVSGAVQAAAPPIRSVGGTVMTGAWNAGPGLASEPGRLPGALDRDVVQRAEGDTPLRHCQGAGCCQRRLADRNLRLQLVSSGNNSSFLKLLIT